MSTKESYWGVNSSWQQSTKTVDSQNVRRIGSICLLARAHVMLTVNANVALPVYLSCRHSSYVLILSLLLLLVYHQEFVKFTVGHVLKHKSTARTFWTNHVLLICIKNVWEKGKLLNIILTPDGAGTSTVLDHRADKTWASQISVHVRSQASSRVWWSRGTPLITVKILTP